jgi:hypothetical protein
MKSRAALQHGLDPHIPLIPAKAGIQRLANEQGPGFAGTSGI